MLGKSQSGYRSGLQNLRVLRDEKTIVEAREAARRCSTPIPTSPRHPGLADAVVRLEQSVQSDYMEKS